MLFLLGPSYPPSELTLSSFVMGGSASWSRGSNPAILTIVPGNHDGVPLLVVCSFVGFLLSRFQQKAIFGGGLGGCKTSFKVLHRAIQKIEFKRKKFHSVCLLEGVRMV